MNTMQSNRDTILLEEAEILSHQRYDGDQYILRIQAPAIAETARAGSFAHIRCSTSLPMRRPISIMRVDREQGWVDFLYKVVGQGTQLLSQQPAGGSVNVLGPIGTPFMLDDKHTVPLLIGGGVGMPPMIHIADECRQTAHEPFVILGSEVPFPFTSIPSHFTLPGIDADINAAMPLLEEWGIPSRLASLQGYDGCFSGYVTDLARTWLSALPDDIRSKVAVYSCGPTPMLQAVAALAHEFNLPCQVSLEEYMACGVGGCAGCVVEVQTEDGPAMKRVCVDGPVFEASSVFTS